MPFKHWILSIFKCFFKPSIQTNETKQTIFTIHKKRRKSQSTDKMHNPENLPTSAA